MVESVYILSNTERIQKVLFDERMHYLHMRLAQGEGLPEHRANSNVYMTILRGCSPSDWMIRKRTNTAPARC